jgi:predicted TIM-barrel fold metal-dependent hydrolase
LFNTAIGDYTWLKPSQPPFWSDKARINQNFCVKDLVLPSNWQLEGFVHIEAGFDNSRPWREVEWLETVNHSHFKTIASIDLCLDHSDFLKLFNRITKLISVVGFRHILDERASELLSDHRVLQNLGFLANTDYIFECQFEATDTQAVDLLCQFLSTQPDFKLVLNHAAFPNSASVDFKTWQLNIQKLSRFNNLHVKAAGWEMVSRNYQQAQIQTVIDHLLVHFAVDKIMLASNFPLCLFSCSYAQLWHNYSQLRLTPKQLEALMYKNAKNFYEL